MSDYTDLSTGTSNVSKLLANLDKYKFNPSGIQRVVLDHLSEVTEGKIDIVDASNPFVFALETASVNTANFIIQNTVNTRRQYPALAQTTEDVYLHMSDVDFVDRFASPAKTVFSIMVEKTELVASMVAVPGTNTKKITIPRNTEFKIADTVFSLQYPIDIIQYNHGGFQILYNNDNPSPLYELSTNVVYWEMRKTAQTQQEWLYIEVDVHQFRIETYTTTVSGAVGFKQSYNFNDQYYYARIYNSSSDTGNLWKEIKTTHTDQVYDPNDPTAVLKVLNGVLEVSIPQIYLSSNKVRGKIRIDIYETKGQVNLILENYLASAFETEWRVIDTNEPTNFIAPLSGLKTIFGFSRFTVSGGKNEISFAELRSRVINNSIGSQQIPITNVQIEASMANKGFSIIKDVDVVTNRIFLASRALPTPFDDKLITAGSASVETVVAAVSDFQAHAMVRSNGARTTLVPELIYRFDNGITTLVTSGDLLNLHTSSPTRRSEIINAGKYFYTPFHYVLDSSSEEFEMRPYYLDTPEVKSVSFVTQNTTTNLQINTVKYSITRNEDSYRVRIVSESNDATKLISTNDIRCYLSFIPENESSRCFLVATTTRDTTNNFVFTFDITSNYDIDSNNNIHFSAFKMLDREVRNLASPLTKDFDLVYTTVSGYNPSASQTDIDTLMISVPKDPSGINDALGNPGIGITHEKIKLFFGYSLNTLWARSRSVLSSSPYRTYMTSSIKTYSEDVYERDPITGAIFTMDAAGNLVYNVKHKVGDPVRDETGNLVYNYKAGDIMMDNNGKPVPVNPDRIVRQLDLTFIDAAYLFATDVASAAYRKQMVTSMISWIVGDIADMSKKLLEQTKMYFYPKTNMGTVKVLADNAVVTNIEAAQNFSVKLYVSSSVFNNPLLKSTISKATIKTIDTILQDSVISISDMVIRLMEVYGGDVISVSVEGLGNGLQTVSLLNENERCSIRKRLTALPNSDLIVEEDVNISFILHEKD